jgi:hypothetical protein
VADNETTVWGRVGDDGTVYVRDGDGEREVGQYPDATPEEALAYYERKFAELAGQVGLLEQRVRNGAKASDVAKTISHLTETVATANAVGDLASLRQRLERLGGSVGELTEKQSAEARAAAEEARIQWKQTSAELDALFASWQTAQKDGPRIPKAEGDALWKRFRAARATLDTHRKAFFAELDDQHKEARSRKQTLVERAEALAPRGSAAIPDYRRLLDDWKLAGRAGKKADDALWARFKAAGDVLYAAKAEADAVENEEFSGNLAQKLELLTEAEKLLDSTDRDAARKTLADIQRRWDAIGKVPRDSIRTVEDRIRKVEAHVRKLDDDHWKRTDPEKQARSSGLAAQLEASIAKLEAELEAAKTAGDKKKVADAEDKLAAQRVWLGAIGS